MDGYKAAVCFLPLAASMCVVSVILLQTYVMAPAREECLSTVRYFRVGFGLFSGLTFICQSAYIFLPATPLHIPHPLHPSLLTADECFAVEHNCRGVLGMANHGRNTNNSQFYITLAATPWMNQQYVAFG